MKTTLFLIAFLFSNIVFSQEYEHLPEVLLTKKKTDSENEKPPIFPKGAMELRSILAKNFRSEKISDSSDIHCDLVFVIDKKGDIIEIKAYGKNEDFNNEAIFALSQIKQKWIPATVNGVPVNYRMKIPLDMKFNVGENAQFPFGEVSFKKKIFENLKMKDPQEKKSCIISFLVDQAGRMKNIGVSGKDKKFNKDVKQAVLKINETWTPKTISNIPVPSVVELTFELN